MEVLFWIVFGVGALTILLLMWLGCVALASDCIDWYVNHRRFQRDFFAFRLERAKQRRRNDTA